MKLLGIENHRYQIKPNCFQKKNEAEAKPTQDSTKTIGIYSNKTF